MVSRKPIALFKVQIQAMSSFEVSIGSGRQILTFTVGYPIVIDECLEIMDLDNLPSFLIVLDSRVELLVLALLSEQLLNCIVVKEIFLRHSKHL